MRSCSSRVASWSSSMRSGRSGSVVMGSTVRRAAGPVQGVLPEADLLTAGRYRRPRGRGDVRRPRAAPPGRRLRVRRGRGPAAAGDGERGLETVAERPPRPPGVAGTDGWRSCRAAGGGRALGARRGLGRLRRGPGGARAQRVHPAAADVVRRGPRGRGGAAGRRGRRPLLRIRRPRSRPRPVGTPASSCTRRTSTRSRSPVPAATSTLSAQQVHQGDLATPLPDRLRGKVDVLVANVPYVPSAAIALMPPESREHEPRSTVDWGADGLDVVRRLAVLAPAWLAPRGVVFRRDRGRSDGASRAAEGVQSGPVCARRLHRDEGAQRDRSPGGSIQGLS